MLDLVLTTSPSLIHNIQVQDGMSDHNIVITDLNLKTKQPRKKPRKIYIYRKADTLSLKQDIKDALNGFITSNSQLENIDHIWTSFKNIILGAMQRHIPTKVISGRWNIPWLTPELRTLIRKKKRYYNQAKLTQSEQHWKRFKDLRKDFKLKLKEAHNEYVLGLLDRTKEGFPSIGKKFWSYIKSLKRDDLGIGVLNSEDTEIEDNARKAELFNKQFSSVFTNEDISNVPTLGPSSISEIPPINFDVQGIIKLLKNLDPKKANGPDDIPCWILKEAAEEIAPYLCLIFQISAELGQVPNDWRKANVIPIYKKGNKKAFNNYRPISLTSVSCKIMEHIIFHHIMGHFDSHKLLVDFQHGFRKDYSCETQLITVIEKVARNLDHGAQTDLLLLDFSKAFDTVPHQRLLGKLDHYGVRGHLKDWLRAWLTERTQVVVVNGEASAASTVTSGVPQGTVLGPLMFLVYINDIGIHIKSNIGLFADDSILYGVIGNTTDTTSLQEDLNRLESWSLKWQMGFNSDKCSVLRVHRSRNPVEHQYTLYNKPLTSVKHHKYLGVELDSKLSWDNHITEIVGKANRSLGFLKRNLNKCPIELKNNAYLLLVRPKLEYASSVWDPHLQKHIKSIEGVQRRAARFVKGCYERTPGTVTRLLNELTWPPLQQRRKEARLTMIYKIINHHTKLKLPSYIQPKQRRTRQYHKNKFINVGSKNNTYKNSFIVRSVNEWNLLPNNIIESNSIAIFKSELKKHF